MKIALIHYWLVTMRGGEKVLEELCRLYPQADIFTHVVVPEKVSDVIKAHKITTSFISRLPGAARHYQKYLPLMPLALVQLDLRNYDLVISSESGPAKGVVTGENTLHLCYCHSPMRYIWNMYHDYRKGAGGFTRTMMAPTFNYLRQWDYVSAARVDHFLANSTTVQRRIAKAYRRKSDVIHPPVAVESFSPTGIIGDYYLYCGQFVPYKRADIAVQAFNRLGKKLVMVGEGSEAARLKKMALPNIHFAGPQSAEALRDLYAACRALVFPGEEDFGIVPVEAMASGRPVIAYDKGGIRDTVRDGSSGILYPGQSVEGLLSAIARFEKEESRFVPAAIAAEAARFSANRFREEMEKLVERKMADFRTNGPFLV
jgi:glycosyltransferase involved in cell wall biosynthesis